VPPVEDADLLFARLPADGASLGNGALRDALGWDDTRYEAARDALVAQRRAKKGPGRGGSLRRPLGPPVSNRPDVVTAPPTAPAPPTGPGFSGWVAPPYRDPEAKSLEQKLWAAADELRANSNLKSSQYSAPVLGLIFLRFADVRFQARRTELEAAASSSRRGSQVEVPSAYHAAGVIWLPESARWQRLVELPEGAGAGAAVNAAMGDIEAANPQLAGTLPRSYESFDGLLLKNLLRKFAEIPVDLGFDAFGRIYEYFLGEFAMSEGQGGGEFYTPSSIVRLLVEVIEPFGGSILDPACGSGGMFVQSAAFVRAHQRQGGPVENRRSQEAPPGTAGFQPARIDTPLRIYGQEKESATAALCRLNLAMHGLEGDIKEAITYYDDAHAATGKFDFVLANPPFNVDNVDKTRLAGGIGKPGSRFPWGVPTTDNANYLWISLFASALKPGGRAGFVMANSASDARGSELAIRQKLIQEGLVEAMVSVGPNMFYTVTLPVTLWFLGRPGIAGVPPARNTAGETPAIPGRVLFIDARQIYRQIDRAHRDWPEAQIGFLSAIVRLFRGESVADVLGGDEAQAKLREVFGPGNAGVPPARNDHTAAETAAFPGSLVYRDVPGLCKAATIAEIEAQGWSLNAGRYVGVAAGQVSDDATFQDSLASLHDEFQQLTSAARTIEAKISSNFTDIMRV
jgi:type I restriction enzyme M protein